MVGIDNGCPTRFDVLWRRLAWNAKPIGHRQSGSTQSRQSCGLAAHLRAAVQGYLV